MFQNMKPVWEFSGNGKDLRWFWFWSKSVLLVKVRFCTLIKILSRLWLDTHVEVQGLYGWQAQLLVTVKNKMKYSMSVVFSIWNSSVSSPLTSLRCTSCISWGSRRIGAENSLCPGSVHPPPVRVAPARTSCGRVLQKSNRALAMGPAPRLCRSADFAARFCPVEQTYSQPGWSSDNTPLSPKCLGGGKNST